MAVVCTKTMDLERQSYSNKSNVAGTEDFELKNRAVCWTGGVQGDRTGEKR